MPDLAQELLASVNIYAVARSGGVLSREQLEALKALAQERHATIAPRCFLAVLDSHLRALPAPTE